LKELLIRKHRRHSGHPDGAWPKLTENSLSTEFAQKRIFLDILVEAEKKWAVGSNKTFWTTFRFESKLEDTYPL